MIVTADILKYSFSRLLVLPDYMGNCTPHRLLAPLDIYVNCAPRKHIKYDGIGKEHFLLRLVVAMRWKWVCW